MTGFTHWRLVPIFAPDVAACTYQPAPQLSSKEEEVTCPNCLAVIAQVKRETPSEPEVPVYDLANDEFYAKGQEKNN